MTRLGILTFGILILTACAVANKEYELCDTQNCGDDYVIETDNATK